MTWFRWCAAVVIASAVCACGDDGEAGDDSVSGSGSGDSGSDAESSATSTADDGSTSGSASASGTGGDAPIHGCVPEVGGLPTDPETKTGVDGTNGLFVDHCDDDGNLVDYMCNLPCLEYDQGPNPVCIEYGPGEATEVVYDCAGMCADGTCDGRCPTHGHQLEISSIDGEAFGFENLQDGRMYDCMLAADMPDDTFDCGSGFSVGETVEITTLGLSTGFCTGANFGSFGVGMPQACTFSCSIAG